MKRNLGIVSEILRIFFHTNQQSLPWIVSRRLPDEALESDENSVALVGLSCARPSSDIAVTDFLSELRDIPFLWGSKGGVPKRKGSFERQRGRHSGMHFKWCHLRLKPWYVCPLCGEPKEAEQVCRKEICRRVRP